MRIVGGMTADAGLRHLVLQTHRLTVARPTVEILVRAVQDEIRALAVVETPDPPPVRVVAAITVGAERPFVLVVRLMACITGHVGALEIVAGMARFAGRHRVQSQEGELREVVIECHAARKGPFVMTARAVGPEGAPMDVIAAVAPDTARVHIGVLDRF